MNSGEELASAMGIPLFRTDLYVPDYRDGEINRWRIRIVDFCLDRGYHTGLWVVRNMPVLLRRVGEPPAWETWMSLSPREVESQETGIRCASGETVIMGLGMGFSAVNVALNQAVDRVTVIESDPDIIDLFEQSGALDGLPEAVANKLEIVEGDALRWRPGRDVDFLYADIWRDLEEPQTLNEVRRMQENVRADQVYYWGQELAIYAQVKKTSAGSGRLNNRLVRRCIEEAIELPLLIPSNMDYASMITRVVENRKAGKPIRLLESTG